MAKYLSSLNTFENDTIRDNLKLFFISLKKLQIISDKNITTECVVISNIICCFIDFIGIQAPDIIFENEELEVNIFYYFQFYILLTIKWLDNYSFNINEIPPSLEIKYFNLIIF